MSFNDFMAMNVGDKTPFGVVVYVLSDPDGKSVVGVHDGCRKTVFQRVAGTRDVVVHNI